MSVRRRPQTREALVSTQRISAGRDEIDDAVECAAVEPGIGQGGANLGIKPIGRKRSRTGRAENVLGENIEGKLPALFPQAGFVDIRRRAHDLGYITTFSLRKP